MGLFAVFTLQSHDAHIWLCQRFGAVQLRPWRPPAGARHLTIQLSAGDLLVVIIPANPAITHDTGAYQQTVNKLFGHSPGKLAHHLFPLRIQLFMRQGERYSFIVFYANKTLAFYCLFSGDTMKIMASVSGYAGEPVTLVALLDPATGVLAIAKQVNYRELADEGYAFVTNTRSASYDSLFTEEHLADAIRAYQVCKNDQTLSFADQASRFIPRIETDGVDEKGQKYRLHEDLMNGEVAVLALVYFQQRQRAIATGTDAIDEYFEMFTI